MAFQSNKVKTYGHTMNILDSEVGLVTKTRTAVQSMAADIDGRKIIKAGSLYTNPDDATDMGVFFEDYDMTEDEARPVSVVYAGRLRKDRVAAEVSAKEADLKSFGLYLI